MPVITLTDAADDRLRDYRDLTDVALRRALEPAQGMYMAEGAKVISRALTAGHRPRSMLLLERWLDPLRELLGPRLDQVPVMVAPMEVIEAVTGFAVHRGALAVMERPALPSLSEVVARARRVVVLESIVDHTNVGAIFRSVAGLGADAVIVAPECADPLYRRSVKVSMGTVFQVPWTRAQAWPGARD
ncbi:MAG: TrmH family RNA methyltransferase, partial [Demequina sp.]